MAEYFDLQNVLKEGCSITDVEEKNNRVYFKVDGHEFQTYGSHVLGKGDPLFDHPVSDFWARQRNTAEGIEEKEEISKQVEEEFELYHKHEAALYKIIFFRAFELLKDKGEEAFLNYINYHFDIMPNGDNCQKLLKKLEE